MKEEKVIRPRDKGDVPDDPLSRMRHSASHVMADAVRRLRRRRSAHGHPDHGGRREGTRPADRYLRSRHQRLFDEPR